ncbi:MAG: Na+/H+ antiporter NhaC family protein [Eubacterium sp.]
MDIGNAGIFSIIPPIVAIVLALVTKEVVFSLMIGILSGSVIYAAMAGLGFVGVFTTTAELMASKLGSNINMILFLVFLGILVTLITKAGGAEAYGNWASTKLKSKRSVLVATGVLGVFFSIDDYFHCLSVGTIMRPVTDKAKISREKLAYQIDAIGAPLCIIMPISSWAASVISYFPEDGAVTGMAAFIRAIPMNLYAMLTLVMVFYLSVRTKSDYGPMRTAEKLAQKGIFSTSDNPDGAEELKQFEKVNTKGRVCDLVIPIAVLLVLSVSSMLYMGGFFSGEGLSIFEALGNTDTTAALALAAFCSVVFTFIYFLARRVLTFKEYFASISQGVCNMIPACIILTLAWSIGGICRDYLLTGEYVANLVQNSGIPIQLLAPMIFIIACFLSFATGTAWGTFGILIPIIISICEIAAPGMIITCLSATLAGSVFGDHCSPISDTTILSSTGAQCNHLKHVGTQIPYAMTVGVCCIIGYIVAGFTNKLGQGPSTGITLVVSLIVLIVALQILPRVWKDKGEEAYQAAEK